MNNYLTTEIMNTVNAFNKQVKYIDDNYYMPDSEYIHELTILNHIYDTLCDLIKKYEIFNDIIVEIQIDSDNYIYDIQ